MEFETIDSTEVEMLFKGAAVSEINKIRANKKDGGTSFPQSGTTVVADEKDATIRKPVTAT